MTIDLNKLIKDHGYKAEITAPESPSDGALRRFKERWLFLTALLLVVCFTATLLVWLVSENPSVDDKKRLYDMILGAILGWAGSVLKRK